MSARRGVALPGLLLGAILLASPAFAQEPPAAPADAPAAAAAPAAPAPAPTPDPDREIDPVQPDFTVINLPTTLRLPRHALAFRLTHRFSRPLGEGDFGDLAADLFGLDSAAQIGLELRFGIFSGTQFGVYRTNDRAMDFFLERDLLPKHHGNFGLAFYGAVEGRNNFSEEFSPAASVVMSWRLGKRATVFATPAWVGNTVRENEVANDDSTLLLGLGTRIRLSSASYLVAEWTPRLAGFKGFDPTRPGESGADQVSFGFEGRVGGHCFQLNFSNFFATTLTTLARGAGKGGDWYIGFNLTRKFY
jgi:hypothetical protein